LNKIQWIGMYDQLTVTRQNGCFELPVTLCTLNVQSITGLIILTAIGISANARKASRGKSRCGSIVLLVLARFPSMLRSLWWGQQRRRRGPQPLRPTKASNLLPVLPEQQYPVVGGCHHGKKVPGSVDSLPLCESITSSSSSSSAFSVPGLEAPEQPSIEHIRNTTTMFCASRVLTTMVEMHLFTELSHCSTGLTHAEMVQLLCLHEDLRPDFLDTLVSLQILVRTGHGDRGTMENATDKAPIRSVEPVEPVAQPCLYWQRSEESSS
jgi:hypothetical protein